MKVTHAALNATPISYQDAKLHLRLPHDLDRDYITNLLSAVTQDFELVNDTTLVSRSVTVIHYDKKCRYELPHGPVNSIVSVVDDDSRTITDYDLTFTGNSAFIKLNEDYSLPLTITYSAGYEVDDEYDTNEVPFNIRQLLLIQLEQWFYGDNKSANDNTSTKHSRSKFIG